MACFAFQGWRWWWNSTSAVCVISFSMSSLWFILPLPSVMSHHRATLTRHTFQKYWQRRCSYCVRIRYAEQNLQYCTIWRVQHTVVRVDWEHGLWSEKNVGGEGFNIREWNRVSRVNSSMTGDSEANFDAYWNTWWTFIPVDRYTIQTRSWFTSNLLCCQLVDGGQCSQVLTFPAHLLSSWYDSARGSYYLVLPPYHWCLYFCCMSYFFLNRFDKRPIERWCWVRGSVYTQTL